MFDTLDRYRPQALGALRIVTALLFIAHGTQKFFNFPPMPPGMPGGEGGMPPLMMVAGTLEVVGGIFILIGLFTRPVAFILCGMMAVAYFLGHFPMSFFPTSNMGDAAVLFCFIYLYLFFAGPGAWSFDTPRSKS